MQKLLLLYWGTVLLFLANPAAAQSIDPSFAAASIYSPGHVFSVVEQPDGKRVAAGTFIRINGAAATSVACFNPDGSLDAAFQQNLGTATGAYRIRKANNGQLLVNSSGLNGTLTIGGISRQEPVRLNANGTVDATFNTGTGATRLGVSTYVFDMLALPNGQTLVVGPFDTFNGVPAPGIVRLTATGAVDASFRAGTGSRYINTIVPTSDGKLLIGGYFLEYNDIPSNALARLNADGSFDPTFTSPLAENTEVSNIVVQANGRIMVTGTELLRLLPSGAIDNSFHRANNVAISTGSYSGDAIQMQADGKLLFISNASDNPKVGRLNADGSLDNTFQVVNGPISNPYSLTLLRTGEVLVAGDFTFFRGIYNRTLLQLTSTGILDNTFQPLIQNPGYVSLLAQQADGRVLAAGRLSEVNGQPVHHLVRFNSDGTLDAAFSANVVQEFPIRQLALQPDGRVLVLTGLGKLQRRLASGLLDNSLNSETLGNFPSHVVLVQPDGRILVGGSFVGNSIVSPKVVRLLPDGTLDATFSQPEAGRGSLSNFERMALQPNGKILVAGSQLVGPRTYSRTVVRLESNGAADPTFQGREFTSSLQYSFYDVAVQADGKVLVGGQFSAYDGQPRAGLVRLNADGALDEGFVPPVFRGRISKVLPQPNNRILVGGNFTSTALPANLLRLLPDGQPDATFSDATLPNDAVNTLLLQSNDRLLVGGNFTAIGSQPRMSLVRLTAPNVLHTAAPRAVAERTHAWPVPAHGTLFVAPAPTSHALSLDLLDALGRPVRHQELRGTSLAQVDVQALPAGLYLLRVHYAEGTVSRAVQVQ